MAGVDLPNQFPNSKMAAAVKAGQSRFQSQDTPSNVLGEQNNVSITASTALTIPSGATYAVITADGGTLYATYDGTVPSSTNYAISLSAGSSLPVEGALALAAIRVIGSAMSVSYWR